MSNAELQKFINDSDDEVFDRIDELMRASTAINNQEFVQLLQEFKNNCIFLKTSKETINQEVILILNGGSNNNSDVVKRIQLWKIARKLKYTTLLSLIHTHNIRVVKGRAKQ